jgi:hypothetical protein
VILHRYIQYLPRLNKLFSYYPVVRRRCRVSARVIVDQNDRRGPLRDRFPKYFSRMHERGIEQPTSHSNVALESMLRVEDRDVKFLDRKILEPLGEDLVDIARPAHGRSFLPLFSGHAPSQLEGGVDTNRTSRSHAADAGKGRHRLRGKQPQRSSARGEYFLSYSECRPPLGPAAEKDSD